MESRFEPQMGRPGPAPKAEDVRWVQRMALAIAGRTAAAVPRARYSLKTRRSKDPFLAQQRRLLLANPPVLEGGRVPDLAYVFFGALALHQATAEERAAWDHGLKVALLEAQVQSGDHAGSWDPTGPMGAPCSSRTGATALAILALRTSTDEGPLFLWRYRSASVCGTDPRPFAPLAQSPDSHRVAEPDAVPYCQATATTVIQRCRRAPCRA